MKSRGVLVGLAALALVTGLELSAKAGAPPGVSFDFAPDDSERDPAVRSWKGRAYLHPSVLADPTQPRPLLVFVHGLNREKTPFRWMGAAGDPDIRVILAGLMESGALGPTILVAPTTTQECDVPRQMWPSFDLRRFLGLAFRHLETRVAVDRLGIVLVGHSGAGCNTNGGILSALRSGVTLRSVLVIDTCMDVVTAPLFALAAPGTDVVIAYQPLGWERPFEDFEKLFHEKVNTKAPRGLRVVERMDIREPSPHGAIVPVAMRKWLSRWISRTHSSGERVVSPK